MGDSDIVQAFLKHLQFISVLSSRQAMVAGMLTPRSSTSPVGASDFDFLWQPTCFEAT